MSEIGTPRERLRLRREGDRLTFARIAPAAGFMSQVLDVASREASAPRLQASTAYRAGARATLVRMPAGYRTTIVT